MKYRKLRIAWSVVWAVVAVLLCVLWVRSYWRWESIAAIKTPSRYVVGSGQGITFFSRASYPGIDGPRRWRLKSRKPDKGEVWTAKSYFGFNVALRSDEIALYLPYWFLLGSTLIAGILTAPFARNLHYRFSLRTALIAVTLVAVMQGIIVWMARG